MYLSIIIPAYNEEKRIGKTLAAVGDFLAKKDFQTEVIVVDDGSNDATTDAVANAKCKIANIKCLNYQVNLGKGAALKTGVLASHGDFVLLTDADSSTPIEELDKLLSYLTQCHSEAEGRRIPMDLDKTTGSFAPLRMTQAYDIAIGSRYTEGANIKIKQPWCRRILGRLGNLIIQLFLLPGITDTQCGFKLFKGDVARELFEKLTINRWGFDMEILYLAKRKGYKIVEVPVIWLNRPLTRLRPVKDALRTLTELVEIKYNSARGRYA